MKLYKIINPFLLLPGAFILLLWIYTWGWSDLFPDITTSTYIFVFSISVVLLAIGILFNKSGLIKYSDLPEKIVSEHKPLMVIMLMCILFAMDVGYSGTIPLLAGDIDDYSNFGLPIIDPLIIALIIFYSIFWFHYFITTKRKIYLLYILFNLALCVLMARRAAMVYIFIAMVCIFIQKIERVRVIVIAGLIVGICTLSYLFGYMGNTKAGLEDDYAVNHLGGSDKFKESGIPNEHYITYLYTASPIANFQLTTQDPVRNEMSFSDLVLREYVPDFIANKIVDATDYKYHGTRWMEQVAPTLNVGTYYVMGYVFYGWTGVVISCVYMILFAFGVYLLYPRKSPYHTVINAFLCAIFLMSLFSNIFRIFAVDTVFILPLAIGLWDRLKKSKIKLTFTK